ncbi:transposase [Clostridium estertheticum]|nr:transposase [Clostridium estertheticum]WLC81789.1 transposase [Clostridium estertheticum]
MYAGPNPRYFGIGRGITSYDLISDQFAGLNKLVITGTIHDSLYLLELVLGQQTTSKPHEIMTGTAGYSDIIFGVFALLGYRFSPRLADIGSTRIWRFDPNAGYIVNLDDVKRLSPLGYDHINIVGHYSFDLAKKYYLVS